MNKTIWLLLFLTTAQVIAAENRETCISVNCDIYREEKAIFEKKLSEIHCVNVMDKSKECDQIALSKLSTDFSKKIHAIFSSPNVNSAIRNDIQFSSMTNSFAAKKQNAPGFYEIVPVLNSPNIGVHKGDVQNNQALVDRLFNIDPSAEDVKNSKWYLTQWKKETPLMLNTARRDHISTNGPTVDGFLGKSAFEIHAPSGKFGVETSLLIFKDNVNNSNVFEIIGRNGWLNNVGGSNVFLSSNIEDNIHNTFDSEINLTFNGKISKLHAIYNENSTEVRNTTVVGQAFAAFTAAHSPTGTSLFVQILFADTRKENFLYKGCYLHGKSVEIVYTHNLDNDFTATADPSNAPLKPKKYYLNKYLCDALRQNYSCPSTVVTPNFKSISNDLKNWKITGFYTGVETQTALASTNQEIPGPIKGTVEMGMQYSNMRVTSNTNANSQTLDCDAVLNRVDPADPVDLAAPPIEAGSCKTGEFTGADGKIIEYSCGCGVIAGAAKQADGCYHKMAADQSPPPVRSPALPVQPGLCTEGKFSDADGKIIEYSCGCGAVPGASKQADGCYHKAASKNTRPPGAIFGSFCVGIKKTNWICNAGDQGEGWVDVGKGCYHQATNEACE